MAEIEREALTLATTATQPLTADDLWEISHAQPEQRFELSEGEIIVMSPTGWLHGDIASELDMRIRQHVKVKQLGKVTAAETGFILEQREDGRDTVRAPDVGFIAAARVPDEIPARYVPFAPDLAVEVVSPGDGATAIHAKVQEFLRAGTQQVWVVYPDVREVVVHSGTAALTLTADDTLDGGDILPGFVINIREIFPEK